MAMITWLGEDDLHPDGNGPRYNEWRGVRFKIGEAVEVDDPRMIAKARMNRFYEVSGDDEPEYDPNAPPPVIPAVAAATGAAAPAPERKKPGPKPKAKE